MKMNKSLKFKRLMVLALLLCGIVGSSMSASALTSYSHEFYVAEYGTWNIFVKKSATTSTKTHYVKNASGYGNEDYCFFRIQAYIGSSGTPTNMLNEKQIMKNSTRTACVMSNTVDKGATCILRVTGTPSQSGQDKAYITYEY